MSGCGVSLGVLRRSRPVCVVQRHSPDLINHFVRESGPVTSPTVARRRTDPERFDLYTRWSLYLLKLAAEAISAGDSPLTPREADVLELAADGAPVEEIAQRAHLSPGTVRNYLSSAAAKLGAANRHEAVHVARRHGWL